MAVRTTKITIETESLLVIREGRTVIAWCPDCQAEVEVMAMADGAAAAQLLSGFPAGTPHIWSRPDGIAQICIPSLMQRSQTAETPRFPIPERGLEEKEKQK